jgi:arabinofuranosyltransferase
MTAHAPPPPARKLTLTQWGLVTALLAATVAGAIGLAFLCDDAFITFRYVANAHSGIGLVWNPPPFQPVEGYTGFLWALMLWAAWSWFGAEPPAAANVLSILCGIGQFALVATAALRLRHRDGSRVPVWVALLVLAAVVTNRTFLQWMTSGLETALFNLTLLAWVLLAFSARRGAAWFTWWSLAAAAAALTRPDGLLLVAATLALGWRRLPRLWPLLLVAAHLAWRRAFYGEWLPNTYYAKVTGAWPEAGLRYFACFAVEHGVWLWTPFATVWAITELLRGPAAIYQAIRNNLPALAAVGAVIFHFAYYTLMVGGDHFEYRVYSHLVPLGVLAAGAMAARLWQRSTAAAVTMVLLALTNGVGWLHLWLTRDMPIHGFRPVTEQLPQFAEPLARWFDRQQAWLRFRMIGLRCNHHAIFLARKRLQFPYRMLVQGSTDPFPCLHAGAVGLASWSLPDTIILDLHGLNDWVIARTPIRKIGVPPSPQMVRDLITIRGGGEDGFLDRKELEHLLAGFGPQNGDPEASEYLATILMTICARQRPGQLAISEAMAIGETLIGARSMAHERFPDPAYEQAIEANVMVRDGVATASPRRVPLTAAAIEAIEAKWREKVRHEYLGR